MMNHLALFVIFFASIFQLTSALTSPIEVDSSTQGFDLNKRVRGTRKIFQIRQGHISGQDSNLRQWKEEDYEALVTSVISGQGNLRHRQMQQNDDYQKKPYHVMQQPSTSVKQWQQICLAIMITATMLMAFYVYALRRELSSLNQYLPLGYKLFPDTDGSEEEEESVAIGVEMK